MKQRDIFKIIVATAGWAVMATWPFAGLSATLSPADTKKLFQVVSNAAFGDHYQVEITNLLAKHDYDGDSDGQMILVDSSLNEAQRVYVTIHEYSHSLIQYGKYSKVDSSRDDVADDVAEYEAESIAHTVARALGVDDPTSDYAQIPVPNARTDLIQKAINYMYQRILTVNSSMNAGLVINSNANLAYWEWPARMCAPYVDMGLGDNFKLTDCDKACGLKHYTLAFIVARQTNNTYLKEASWDGRIPIGQGFYRDQIRAIRKRGGDVIVSFGGKTGKELADVIDDAPQLEAAYQKVINRYKLTWLDFDVEGTNLDQGGQDNERRNTTLANIEKKNPALIISYTLPVDSHGLSQASLTLLADAKTKGVKVHSVNLMMTDFGGQIAGGGKSEGELGVDSANAAFQQLQKIDPAIQVGLCPSLGNNGSSTGVFTLDDARTFRAFADKTPWVCALDYWSINNDTTNAVSAGAGANGGTFSTVSQPWAFAKTFESFATKATQSSLW